MSGTRGFTTLPPPGVASPGLRTYATLARAMPLSYRNKIMLITFVGTHVPLLALVTWYAWSTAANLAEALKVIGVALAATMIGTAATLTLLHQLLRPILITAQALRLYATDRQLPTLPIGFTDEAGTLMTDTVSTLARLDTVLDELAYIDRVTGLPNRDRMLRQLAEQLSNGRDLALCVVVLRNADAIIAAFGEAGMDDALRTIAARLSASLGYGSLVARLEGPRIAVVLDADTDEPGVTLRLDRILALLRQEIVQGEMRVLPDIGLGVALAPEDAMEAEALLDAAQAAVPATGGAAPVFYSPAAQALARQRLDLDRELRRALEQDELSLHFQPVVRAEGEGGRARVVGAEALLRWQHPVRGMIPPGVFIPVAERSGLIDPIGVWVLRTGCRHLRSWDEAGLSWLRLAVNLSARQFGDRRLVRIVGDALTDYAVPPQRLEVEMTESAAMQDREMTRRVFGELHAMGTTVAIDDFGTGYSTMSHLRDLRFDRLKIDREFVRHVDQSRSGLAICRALIELARGLDIEVLAEGVETADEVGLLQHQGCELFQGYYFGRPMPGDAFLATVRAEEEGRLVA